MTKIEAVQTRLMSAINTSQDQFCIFDARDRIVIWNSAFAKGISPKPDELQRGTTKQQTIEMRLANGYFDAAVGREAEFLQQFLEDWQSGRLSDRVVKIKGRDFKANLTKAPNGDRVLRYVDVSEQLRQQRELERYAKELEDANREISLQAMQDELTGLGNRRAQTNRSGNRGPAYRPRSLQEH